MKLPFNLGTKAIKTGQTVKAISPELCMVGSIALGIGCVVTSCIATVKSEPVVRKARREIIEIRKLPEKPGEHVSDEKVALVPVKELKDEDRARVQVIRVNECVEVAKNFAIPVLLGLGSIALHICDHKILRDRLAATSVALAGLAKSFDEYRGRVIADLGKEKDQEYMHGLKKRKEVELDPKTGEVIGEKDVYFQEAANISQYARMFDEGEWDDVNKRWIHQNLCWKDDPFINQKNLREIEREMNDKLRMDGFLFLNDVYRRLGLPLSIDGQIVGWSYTGERGDHAVSFGVFDDDPRQLPCNKAFLDGKTPNALLDFNVDGPIINELEKFFGKEYAMKYIASNM